MNTCKCGAELNSEITVCLACRKKEAKEAITPADVLPKIIPPVIMRQLGKNPKLNPAITGSNKSFFLTGSAGIGKSHQAAILMYQHCVEQGRGVRAAWVNVPKLLFDIRQTFQNKWDGAETEGQLVKCYSESNWLCLDDLGVEKSSDFALQTLYLIINERYEQERTTVITSNLDLLALSEKMGDDRLTSRIAGMCQTVELEGKDRRE